MNKENVEDIPVFKSWTRWYWIVLGFELAQIALFWLLTNYFA